MWKLLIMCAMKIFIARWAYLYPMHFLGPWENGMKANGWTAPMFSGKKRSGLNWWASGPQRCVDVWKQRVWNKTIVPAGSKWSARMQIVWKSIESSIRWLTQLKILSRIPNWNGWQREKPQAFLYNHFQILHLPQWLVAEIISTQANLSQFVDNSLLNVLMHRQHQKNIRYHNFRGVIALENANKTSKALQKIRKNSPPREVYRFLLWFLRTSRDFE